MANTGQPDSGGCQFFITDGPMNTWNGKYTIFGTVVDGQNVVAKINHAPVRGDRPVEPVKLIGVTIQRVGPEPVKKPKK
jgi:cyclophilin family peptidyl-prolyl cis-trans isomerase